MQAAYDCAHTASSADAYGALLDCTRPWTIRRWGDTMLPGPGERPLVALPSLHINDIQLKYTEDELENLQTTVEARHEETKAQSHFCDALYIWRLESFQLGLQDSQFCLEPDTQTSVHRQS